MEDKIYYFVDSLISYNRIIADKVISSYEDLSKTIDGLYIDEIQKKEIKSFYLQILETRRNMHECPFVEFCDLQSSFVVCVTNYLDAVKNFFRDVFYMRTGNSLSALPVDVLCQIVETDMHKVSEGDIYYADGLNTIRVDIGNPMILESLYLVALQYDDFSKFLEKLNIEKDTPRYFVYFEFFKTKVENLFEDITFLYDKEYYRIIDFDDDAFQFIARRDDDFCSIEKIPAYSLFDKIIFGVERKRNETYKCLVIGEVTDGSKKLLNDMLKESLVRNFKVDYYDERAKVRESLSNSDSFVELIKNYEKIFVLDCPEIYGEVSLQPMSDDVQLLKRSERSFIDLMDVSETSSVRDFYNMNGFSAIYYRVQNYLLRADIRNGSKTRRLNKGFLSYMDNFFKCNETGYLEKLDLREKELYIYLSNVKDFKDDLFDSYNFVRLERFNSKEARMIKFSNRIRPSFNSPERKLSTNFFKILKAMSNSEEFFCRMTGDMSEDFSDEKIAEAIRIAQNTKVDIGYGAIDAGGSCIKVKIDVMYSFEVMKDELRRDAFQRNLTGVLLGVFDLHANMERTENRVLIRSFHEAMANVLLGSSKSFNNLLFYHLYERSYVIGEYDYEFNADISLRPSAVSRLRVPETNNEENTSYSYKRTACAIMDDLDGDFYRESDIVSHVRKTVLNKEDIGEYAGNIKDACENLGYTNSSLYFRLKRYYC